MKIQNIYLNVIGKTRCFNVDTIRIPWKKTFTDLFVWMGIRNVIDSINANAAA